MWFLIQPDMEVLQLNELYTVIVKRKLIETKT